MSGEALSKSAASTSGHRSQRPVRCRPTRGGCHSHMGREGVHFTLLLSNWIDRVFYKIMKQVLYEF